VNLVNVRKAVETTLAGEVLAKALLVTSPDDVTQVLAKALLVTSYRPIQVYMMTSCRCWPRHCS